MKISFSSEDPMRPAEGPSAESVGEVMSNILTNANKVPAMKDASDMYELHECGFRGLPAWNPDGCETARVCQSCGEIQERSKDAQKQGAD